MVGFSFISLVSELSFLESFHEVITFDLCIRILCFLFVCYLGWFSLSWSFFFDEVFA